MQLDEEELGELDEQGESEVLELNAFMDSFVQRRWCDVTPRSFILGGGASAGKGDAGGAGKAVGAANGVLAPYSPEQPWQRSESSEEEEDEEEENGAVESMQVEVAAPVSTATIRAMKAPRTFGEPEVRVRAIRRIVEDHLLLARGRDDLAESRRSRDAARLNYEECARRMRRAMEETPQGHAERDYPEEVARYSELWRLNEEYLARLAEKREKITRLLANFRDFETAHRLPFRLVYASDDTTQLLAVAIEQPNCAGIDERTLVAMLATMDMRRLYPRWLAGELRISAARVALDAEEMLVLVVLESETRRVAASLIVHRHFLRPLLR